MDSSTAGDQDDGLNSRLLSPTMPSSSSEMDTTRVEHARGAPIGTRRLNARSLPGVSSPDLVPGSHALRPRPRLRPTPNRKGLCETLSCARPGQSAPPIRSAVVVGSRSRNHQRKLANSLPLLVTDPMCHLPSANRRREDAARKEGKRPLPNPNPSFRRVSRKREN